MNREMSTITNTEPKHFFKSKSTGKMLVLDKEIAECIVEVDGAYTIDKEKRSEVAQLVYDAFPLASYGVIYISILIACDTELKERQGQ